MPPGTYRPTAAMGRVTREQHTPGIVSRVRSGAACAAWKAAMLARAVSNAARTSSGRSGTGGPVDSGGGAGVGIAGGVHENTEGVAVYLLGMQ